MRVINYREPHSSFLSVDKDLQIIIDNLLKNKKCKSLFHQGKRLWVQKLLYYKYIKIPYYALTTFAAWGPFAPSITSNSTLSPSWSVL